MTTITVSNASELSAALASAVGGDTIKLQAGNYGNVSLNQLHYSSNVTIVSADPAHQAHIDQMTVYNSQNLTFSSLDFGRGLQAGEPVYTKMIELQNDSNLVFDSVNVHGSLDGNPQNDGWGILAQNVDGFKLSNSEVHDILRGLIVNSSSNVTVVDNNVHMIANTGTGFAGVTNALVDGNYYTDFHPVAGAHPDAIQFWTAGQTKANTNITITNNELMLGVGVGTQGIFLNEENGSLPYNNVNISNNLIYSSDQWHGISVYHADGLNITNNTVVSRTDDNMRLWIYLNNDTNAHVHGNVTDQILLENTVGQDISGNYDFHADPSKTALIPNLNAGAAAKISDFVIPDYGFHPVGTPAPAPAPTPTPTPAQSNVSGVLSNVLASFFKSHPHSGASVTHVLDTSASLPSSSGTAHATTQAAAKTATVATPADVSHSAIDYGLVPHGTTSTVGLSPYHHFDHFTAMA